MKMKKVVSFLMAGAMVLGLAACGAKTEGSKTSEAAGSETGETAAASEAASADETGDTGAAVSKVTIQWPETDSTQVDVIENYIQPALTEKFPDVEFEYVGTTADSPVKTQSASDDLPDIFFVAGDEHQAIVNAGDALDIAPYVTGDGWLDEHYTNPAQLYNGDAIYHLVPGQNDYYTPVVYYNADLFKTYNLEVPSSLDELVQVCQTLKDNGVTPITTTAQMAAWGMIDALIEGTDPAALDDLHARKCDWTDDRIKQALGYFDQLKQMGAFTPDIASKDDATALSEFQSGTAAMWSTYSWCNYDVTEDNLGFVPGEFNWPAAPGHDYRQLTFATNTGGFSINAECENPEFMVEIMKVMVEAEAQRHAANGIGTNYKVDGLVEAENPLERQRVVDYNNAGSYRSVLTQSAMDGTTLAEWYTMFGNLVSDDAGYMSAQFIEEFNPVWEANTYPAD